MEKTQEQTSERVARGELKAIAFSSWLAFLPMLAATIDRYASIPERNFGHDVWLTASALCLGVALLSTFLTNKK